MQTRKRTLAVFAIAASAALSFLALAQAAQVRLTHTADLANNQVAAFEFEYCRFEPARFT